MQKGCELKKVFKKWREKGRKEKRNEKGRKEKRK